MSANEQINIRSATVHDREFIISLIPRLIEFGPPAWRDASKMTAVDAKVLNEKLLTNPPDTAIFIAEDAKNVPLGFIHIQAGSDYYNTQKHGHISDIIVAPQGEGRGIARLLMKRGEEWARSQGFQWITLNVFSQNVRAREVYERLGFGEDIIKYVKKLN